MNSSTFLCLPRAETLCTSRIVRVVPLPFILLLFRAVFDAITLYGILEFDVRMRSRGSIRDPPSPERSSTAYLFAQFIFINVRICRQSSPPPSPSPSPNTLAPSPVSYVCTESSGTRRCTTAIEPNAKISGEICFNYDATL